MEQGSSDDIIEMEGQFKEQFEKLKFMVVGKLDETKAQRQVLLQLGLAFGLIREAIRSDHATRAGPAVIRPGVPIRE
jgi:hypothetical protein